MSEHNNFVDETEVEHIDGDEVDDGDEVIVVFEMVVEMMINEQDDEVDMYYHL